jgi:rfaE bifunctional protein kinase chain/domain
MKDLIRTIKDRFPGRKVAIAGDLVADQFLHGSITRVSREAPVFILRHQNTETRPGAAANAAANVASLGGEPLLVGAIGADANGALLRESLGRLGVDCRYLASDPAVTTTTKVRVLAGHHYSARQQVIRIDYEGGSGLSPSLRETLIANLRAAAGSADAIVISDYNYGVANSELFEEAKVIATERNIPLLIDSRFRLREFPGATSATPNQEEVEQMIGAAFSDDDCGRLCRELGFQALLVTCGNKGVILADGKGPARRLPAIGPIEPVDVTGAGDTVIAAYALGLASGLGFFEAAAVADHAGGIVVMKQGTATASRAELIESLAAGSQLALTDSAR